MVATIMKQRHDQMKDVSEYIHLIPLGNRAES